MNVTQTQAGVDAERNGGSPIVVDEPTIAQANALARETTGIDVDHTGSSGLAGLLALMQSPDKPLPTERVVVLFTGVRRDYAPPTSVAVAG